MERIIHGVDCAVRGPTCKCDCGVDDELLAELARAERALRDAISHIEHMAKFISGLRSGYSFEGLGEDMPSIRAARGEG